MSTPDIISSPSSPESIRDRARTCSNPPPLEGFTDPGPVSDDYLEFFSEGLEESGTSKLSKQKEKMEASVLSNFPVMGVYHTLLNFRDHVGVNMGAAGTHPWTQGSPLSSQIPGGPDIDINVNFSYADVKYPGVTGDLMLRNAIKDYYNHFYGSNIDADNITVFPGGRPAIYSTLCLLKDKLTILVEETEYTPYYDFLIMLKKMYKIIPSNPENNFRPDVETYATSVDNDEEFFMLKSNPANPTGVVWRGDQLKSMIDFCSKPRCGGLFDEAYEFMASPPVSAMEHIPDINDTNLFVVSGATKGLQSPGLRVGWVISSKANTLLFRNFSCTAMGGTSLLSQICVAKMLDIPRLQVARTAISAYYGKQRERYAAALIELGFTLYTGPGGFYHWALLPNNLTTSVFNERLFTCKAAILPGMFCDMHRRGEEGYHSRIIRFSFGPLKESSFDEDIAIIKKCCQREFKTNVVLLKPVVKLA